MTGAIRNHRRVAAALPSRKSANNKERLKPLRDGVGKRPVGIVMRQISLAGKKTQKGAAALRAMIANSASEDWIGVFERVEHGALRDRTNDLKCHLAGDMGVHPEVRWQHDADHVNVWTSTESTGGRSRTIAVHVSPASAEA